MAGAAGAAERIIATAELLLVLALLLLAEPVRGAEDVDHCLATYTLEAGDVNLEHNAVTPAVDVLDTVAIGGESYSTHRISLHLSETSASCYTCAPGHHPPLHPRPHL